MTTWEVASASELNELRMLIGKVERLRGTPPVRADELAGMTKRRAGQLVAAMRQMVKGDDAVKGERA